jgi:hypothetical protein
VLGAGGEALRQRLVGKSRKCDSSHEFDSGLAWEKESDEGNASKVLRRCAGVREGGWRQGAAAELRRAIVRAGRRETEGKKASVDDHLHTELLRRAGVMERRDGGAPEMR